MVINHVLIALWFADHPEYLVLLTFLLHSFFDFVPLVYQRRSDRIVINLLFCCSHGNRGYLALISLGFFFS